MLSTTTLRNLDKTIGRLLCLQLLFFKIVRQKTTLRQMERNGANKRFLIIKLWALGDSVYLLPVLKTLKLHFSSAKIYVLATQQNIEVFRDFRYVDNIIEIDAKSFSSSIVSIIKAIIFSRKMKFEVVIDAEAFTFLSSFLAHLYSSEITIGFNYNSKIRSFLYSNLVTVNEMEHVSTRYLSLIRPLGIEGSISKLEKIATTQNDKENAQSLLTVESTLNGNPIVGVYVGPFVASPERQWPIARFAMLCDKLIERRFNVVFVGAKSEQEYIRDYLLNKMKYHPTTVVGKTTMKQLAALMEYFDVFISSDAGPLHIASAMGTPVVALFGPGNPQVYGPLGEQNTLLYKNPRCGPCIDAFKGYAKKCKEKTCLESISVEEVLSAVECVLHKKIYSLLSD